MSLIARQTVASRMRSAFIRAEVTDNLLQIAQLMQLARIRHLPVLDGDALVGIVSHRDVLEFAASPHGGISGAEQHEHLRSISVVKVMRARVHTIGSDASLAEAAQEMLRYKIGCLPVVAAEVGTAGQAGPCMIGLITESDLLAAAYLPTLDARTLEPCASENWSA